MILSALTNKLIELGMTEELASNLEMAHNRFIRSSVENTPSLKRVSQFMSEYREDMCDELGDEKGAYIAELAIAHGAIMHFSKATLKVNGEGKLKERIGKDEMVKEIVTAYQTSTNHPEYDILAIEDEYFDL